MSPTKYRVRALARMAGGFDPVAGGSFFLEHLLDCLDQAGVDPRTVDLPPAALPCAGDDHRDGCPVAFGWHVRALGWVLDVGEAVEAGLPEPPPPPPAPGCYALWTRHTAHPLRRRR